MNALNAFVAETSADNRRVTAADLVRHVDHIAQLVGVQHVGLGFDLCDNFKNYLNTSASLETYDVLAGHQNLPEFTLALIDHGYSDGDILLILGGNFMRVYHATL